MRIGTCASPAECKAIKEIGYDYVELNFSKIARIQTLGEVYELLKLFRTV